MFNHLNCKCPEPIYPNGIELHMESVRLQTFYLNNWQSHISPKVLARIGFYYLKSNDNVRCHFCNLDIGMWQGDDNPLIEHLKYSPFCPVLMEDSLENTNNVPTNEVNFRILLNFIHGTPEIKHMISYRQNLSKSWIFVCKLDNIDADTMEHLCKICYNRKSISVYPCDENTCTNKKCENYLQYYNSNNCEVNIIDELKKNTRSNNVIMKKINL